MCKRARIFYGKKVLLRTQTEQFSIFHFLFSI